MRYGLVVFDTAEWLAYHRPELQRRFLGAVLTFTDDPQVVEEALARMLGTDAAGSYRSDGPWSVVLIVGDHDDAETVCDTFVERGYTGLIVWYGLRPPMRRYSAEGVRQRFIPADSPEGAQELVTIIERCWNGV